MIMRILCGLLAMLLLAGCNENAGTSVMPPPAALNSDAMGVFCGMNLMEHPGPKGQIITASRIDPFWFTSVRDTVAFTLMPEQPRDIKAIYVSDMARATNWDEPGTTNWVDARKAFFVIESRKQGGMGAAEAVPFGNREAADVFVAANGKHLVHQVAVLPRRLAEAVVRRQVDRGPRHAARPRRGHARPIGRHVLGRRQIGEGEYAVGQVLEFASQSPGAPAVWSRAAHVRDRLAAKAQPEQQCHERGIRFVELDQLIAKCAIAAEEIDPSTRDLRLDDAPVQAPE